MLKSLGLLWSRNDLYSIEVRADDETDEILVPLSSLLVPNIMENLRLHLKDTRGKKTIDVELGKLSRKEFLDWYRNRTSMKT